MVKTKSPVGNLGKLRRLTGSEEGAAVSKKIACPAVLFLHYRSISYLLPVPESGTSCGLPSLTLSVTVRVAVREPVALGVNVTAMVQLSLGASELGQ